MWFVEHRPFYRRPLFLILVSLAVLAYGFPTGPAAKAVNTVSGGALANAQADAAWNQMTPDRPGESVFCGQYGRA